MVNEKTSFTGRSVSARVTEKFLHNIATAIFISRKARFRPGHKRDLAPRGVLAIRL
jgi:hypothetical protein